MSSTKPLRPLAALTVVLALTSACAGSPPPPNGRVADGATPLDQYPIHATERPEELALAVHPQGRLSPAQESALAGLARSWREAGSSAVVVVQSPSASDPDAQLSVRAAADRLVAFGVAPAALRLAASDPGAAPGGAVTVRFDRLVAEAPDCNTGWDNLVATKDNKVSTHFGCANARNFAVMLADPHDLLTPRSMTPADAGRRAMVLDNYRKGAITASAKDDQADGAVSQKVR